MRKLSSIMSIILVVCLSIGGVSAAWVYSSGAVDAVKALIEGISMGTWEFGYTLTFQNEDRTFLEKQMNQGDTIDLTSTSEGSPIYALWEQIKDFQNNDPGNLKADYSNFDTSTVDDFVENHFDYWINTGSTRVDSIESDRTEDLVLFPTFKNLYNAIFVDLDGNILDWTTFSATTAGYNKVKNLGNSVTAPNLTSQSMDFVSWEVKETDADGNNVASYALDDLNSSNFGRTDITIYPVYQYSGTASLTPVDKNGDGDTDYYQVDGYSNGEGSKLVEIPAEINGIPIEAINTDAFNTYDDLTAVRIPASITSIGGQVFSDSNWSRQTVTLYYEGTPTDLKKSMDVFYTTISTNTKYTSYNEYQTYPSGTSTIFNSNWDYGMGNGSRIFFLGIDGNVDTSAGYWELFQEGGFLGMGGTFTWIFHDHPYDTTDSDYQNCPNASRHYGTITPYTNGTRVDYKYWNGIPDSEETTTN